MQPFVPAIIYLLLSAFFTGVESAFISANKLKIEVDKGRDLFSAKLVSGFFSNPTIFRGTLWLWNILAMVMYTVYADHFFVLLIREYLSETYTSHALVLLVEILLIALIYIIFAESVPGIIFRTNANTLLKISALPVYIIYIITYPLVVTLMHLGRLLLKYMFRANVNIQDTTFSMSDLDNLLSDTNIEPVKESEEYQELQMFVNARDLSNIKLREFMVPRNEIVAIDKTQTPGELGSLIVESGHSKIIVFDQSIDNTVGYAHAYDIFSRPSAIAEIIKPLIIVPGTMTADRLLNKFIVERKSVALVVDEFGGTDGMLTIEDILEEIFGDIEDEYDVEEDEDKQIGENEYLVSGRLEIDYLNEKYNLGLPESDDYQTLAGYIIHFHENIPSPNEEISIGNSSFIITEASETKIEKVLIKVKREAAL